jgi:predicted ArsR family transcriptional regulator
MAATLRLPAAVREQPPSTRLVYLALLEGETPLTVATIHQDTGVSADRVRRVLGHLCEEDLVAADDHPKDGRRKMYSLARGANRPITAADDCPKRTEEHRSARLNPSDPGGAHR